MSRSYIPVFDLLSNKLMRDIMKIIASIILVLMLLHGALAQSSPAGDHSCMIGTAGINEISINWTDEKNYDELKTNVDDWNTNKGLESFITTDFNLYAKENSRKDYTLWYDVSWHPAEKRQSTLKPDEYPFEITSDETDLKSGISIQKKNGILVRFKEEKIYNGSEKPPTIIDPLYYVCYFPDDYTEVIIRAPAANWTMSEIKSMLDSLVITMPKGYY